MVSFTSEFDHNTWSILNVKPGQQIEISLRSCNVDNYHIIFADKNNNVLSHYINDADKEYNNFKITVPKYAVKMGVNSYSYLPTIKIYTCISPLVNKKYIDTISKKIGEDVNLISNKIAKIVKCKPNIEFISRQGQLNDFPENSLHGIKCAYENGYNNIRVSVIMTKDNIPVLCHDETINRLARNMDGSIISETKYIKDLTLSQLNQYDWGRWSEKTELYGLNITTLEEFIKFAKYRGIKIRLEFKHDFTDDNISKIVELIAKWGMINKTTFCGGATDLDRVYARCKTCDFALIGHLNSALIPHVLKYKNEHNNVCLDIFTDDYDLVTPNLMLELKNNNIFINAGSAINVSEMVKWFEVGVDFIEVAYVSEPYDAIYNQYR